MSRDGKSVSVPGDTALRPLALRAFSGLVLYIDLCWGCTLVRFDRSETEALTGAAEVVIAVGHTVGLGIITLNFHDFHKRWPADVEELRAFWLGWKDAWPAQFDWDRYSQVVFVREEDGRLRIRGTVRPHNGVLMDQLEDGQLDMVLEEPVDGRDAVKLEDSGLLPRAKDN